MPFREATRDWWMRVGNNTCQYEYYNEKGGWQQCTHYAEHVHHIIPEGWLLDHGEEPEHSTGMPLCTHHHVKFDGDEEWNYYSSMHPEIAWAYSQYRDWKMRASHQKEIGLVPEKNPFQEMVEEHRKHTQLDERYWSTSPEMDQYYIDKMTMLAWQYVTNNPEDKRPDTKDHWKHDPEKSRRWTNGFYK